MASQNCSTRGGSGLGRRIASVLLIGFVAAAVVSLATNRSTRVAPAPAEPMSRMTPRRLQAHASDNAVIGGATAGQQALAAANILPDFAQTTTVSVASASAPDATPDADATHPWSPHTARPAVLLPHVRSESPHPTREKALADAVNVARLQLRDKFRALDPPLDVLPSAAVVQTEYLHGVTEVQPTAEDRAAWAEAKVGTSRLWVDVTVAVSDEQVRQLRSASRVDRAGVYAGLAFVLLAAAYGFLRFDALTRGYLTTVLAIVAAVVACGGGAVLLYFVRSSGIQ